MLTKRLCYTLFIRRMAKLYNKLNPPQRMKLQNELFTQNTSNDKSVVVSYLVTSPLDPTTASVKLCIEQSLSHATNNDQELIKRFSAKYVPSSIKHINPNQFSVDIVFPLENTENSLSMVLSAIGGDTFNIKDLNPIKILSIKLPTSFIQNYSGPAFGIDGLREKLRCYSRPILCGPIKPCIGLSAEKFAQRAKEALLGGADIVKDDELICNPPYNTLSERVTEVARVVKAVKQKTKEEKMYFAFIGSGAPSQIIKNAKIAKDSGADGFMVSPAINGFEIIQDLKNEFGLPIIAHNALQYGAYTKNHGFAFSIFALFQRLCGADIIITPAKYGTFDVMTKDEQLENITILQNPIPSIKKSFPAFCGGQTVATALQLRADVGNNDFILVCGTSLYDHPNGPEIGARELRKSLDSL